MKNLLDEFVKVLSEDNRLVSEGKLMKNKIIELAMNLDPSVIRPLLNNSALKTHFFKDIDGILVFDKIKFQQFVSNKSFLPDSFTSYKNKIGLASSHDYLSDIKEVVLAWPYKDCVLEGGQDIEDAKRNEVFWNETLAPNEIDRLLSPKVLVNFRRYDKDGVSESVTVDEFMNGNLIIRGNNLLALHTLKKKYTNKIKLIYIDPPYNTGSDSFKYNDNFNHATWLTFMRNRLSVALSLLESNGFICIHCSFHEFAHLKVLCDELIGPKCWRTTFNVLVRHPDRTLTGDKEFNDVVEYTLVYSKTETQRLPSIKEFKVDDDYVYEVDIVAEAPYAIHNFDNKEVKVYLPEQYKVTKKQASSSLLKTISIRGSIKEKNSSGRFYVKHLESLTNQYPPLTLFVVPNMGDDAFGYRYFHLPKEGNKNGTYFQGMPQSTDTTERPIPNFLDYMEEYNIVNSEGGVEFRNGKKPESLIAFYIELLSAEGDIVLDYHLGSGTTASVAQKLGRRFIGIEQMDYIESIAVERLKLVIEGEPSGISNYADWKGGGSFVYCELARANQTFADLIVQAKTNHQLNDIYADMCRNAFLSYRVDLEAFNASKQEFEVLELEVQKAVLLEMLDKNLLYVPFSEIEDASFGISEKDKSLNRRFFGLDK